MTINDQLRELFTRYQTTIKNLYDGQFPYPWNHEIDSCQKFAHLLQNHANPFSRTNYFGHITGSAFIYHPKTQKVLLTLHKKLGKWLQLGGHSDSQCLPHQTAIREGLEESGLHSLSFSPLLPNVGQNPLPFDLDIHVIPERKNEPQHFHFDVRYLLRCNEPMENISLSDESSDLAWMSLSQAKEKTTELSMHRQFDKFIKLSQSSLINQQPKEEPNHVV